MESTNPLDGVAAVNTIIVVSDWRNSLDPKFNDGREAELKIAFGTSSA